MCFSAEASFGSAIVIGAIGIVTLSKAKKSSQIPFAAIPLMFAIQQASEGMLWIGLADPAQNSWSPIPIYIFLIFAQFIWPVWVPFSIYLLEKQQLRRKVLKVFLGIGLVISSYLLYCIFVYDVSAEIHQGHIRYSLSFPVILVWLSGILYFTTTVITPFVSGVKGMATLGFVVLISFVVARFFFEDHLISVWCFFAAVISAMILLILRNMNKTEKKIRI